MAEAPYFFDVPKIDMVTIVTADSTNQKDWVTAGSVARKISALMVATDDTAAKIPQISVLRSSVNYIIGTTSVALGSGTNGTAPNVNLLTLIPGLPLDSDGQPYLYLEPGDKLQVKLIAAATSAKTWYFTAISPGSSI